MEDSPPAFLFYVDDFAAGTADMAPHAIGIYVRCLCHQWGKGFVPNDRTKIARICGATLEEVESAWGEIVGKFEEIDPGKLANRRMESERQKLLARREARSEAGKRGADARWNDGKTDGNANGKPIAHAKQSDSKHMASRVGNGNGNGIDLGSDNFSFFWSVVHTKEGKQAAAKAYEHAVNRLKVERPGTDPHEFLRERMAAFAATPSANPTDRSPIHPATWLNLGRYDDDPAAWQRNGRANGGAGHNDPRGVMAAAQTYLSMGSSNAE